MASLLDEHEFSVSSRSWWWTGKPGKLEFLGSQRAWYDWVTELNFLSCSLAHWLCGKQAAICEVGYSERLTLQRIEGVNQQSMNWGSVQQTLRNWILPTTTWMNLLEDYPRVKLRWGFPDGISGKEPAWKCRGYKRCMFNTWVGKIPQRRSWKPIQYLAWRIPWIEEPEELQSIGLQSQTQLKWLSPCARKPQIKPCAKVTQLNCTHFSKSQKL